MADDVRQRELAAARPAAPAKSSANNGVQETSPAPPENANLLPGGTMNTAGGKMREASYVDAVKTIKLSDLKEFHKRPCVREALMTGIGAGFCVGGLRAVLGAPILRASNWAVGSFMLGSFLMHEYCQHRRTQEHQGIKRAVEVLDRRRAEKRLEAQSSLNKSPGKAE